MTTIVPRPALDPADWQLSRLAIFHPTDLFSFDLTIPYIGSVEPRGTWIEAELIPLTPRAIELIFLLPGHRFSCQGQLFEVTGGYVRHSSEQPVVVSITCEQIHDAQEQPILSPLILEPQ
ncbi:MAG: hypothetical protein VKM34_10745 [Cyanobacteriota bacterium]|nr:hypothetical protein [Cyanobacteriota bacterium]